MQIEARGGPLPLTPNRIELAERYAAPDWRLHLRPAVLIRARGRCERCGEPCTGAALIVHHLTYERLWHEELDDLLGVCPDCHPIVDREREMWERWQHRVNGFARRRYGPAWQERVTFDEVSEALERRLGYGPYEQE